jgi:hypothetical protein
LYFITTILISANCFAATYFIASGNDYLGNAGSDSNDGLDMAGFGLSNATFDFTGNGEGELHLSLSSAFTSYTFQAGDTVHLQNAAGGVTVPALYEIASKVDNDAILLVADSGLTSDSTSDVDSSSGPYLTGQKGFDIPVATDIGKFAGTFTPSAPILIDAVQGTVVDHPLFVGVNSRGVEDGTLATFNGSSLSSNANIVESTNNSADFYDVRHMRFTGATGSTGHGFLSVASNGAQVYITCQFDGNGGDGLRFERNSHTQVINCLFRDNGGNGLGRLNTQEGAIGIVTNCVSHNNTGNGFEIGIPHLNSQGMIVNCLAYSNTGHGIFFNGADAISTSNGQRGLGYAVINTTSALNTLSGLRFAGPASGNLGRNWINILNSTFAHNGVNGIDFNDFAYTDISDIGFFDFNNFNGNTSGHIDLLSDGAFAALTITSTNNTFTDPSFENISAGTEDFEPGSGSPLLAVGLWNTLTVNADDGGENFVDVGAFQREQSAGGGGGPAQLINGGLVR